MARTAKVEVRMTEADAKWLREHAKTLDLTVSDVVRRAVRELRDRIAKGT